MYPVLYAEEAKKGGEIFAGILNRVQLYVKVLFLIVNRILRSKVRLPAPAGKSSLKQRKSFKPFTGRKALAFPEEHRFIFTGG